MTTHVVHISPERYTPKPPNYQLKCSCGRSVSFSDEEMKILRDEGLQALIQEHQDNPILWERYI